MDELKNGRDELDAIEEGADLAPEFATGYVGQSEEVIERYCRCHLCGSHLHFTHSTDFANNLTHETARCPECGIRSRELIHKLQ